VEKESEREKKPCKAADEQNTERTDFSTVSEEEQQPERERHGEGGREAKAHPAQMPESIQWPRRVDQAHNTTASQ